MKHLLLTTIAAVVLVGCGNPDGALTQATIDGNIEAAKQAIAAGADVNAKDVVGMTPLHHAAIGGHKEIAELLIAAGADVNARQGFASSGDGWVALIWAIEGGHNAFVELLIENGADVNAKNEWGQTPLDFAHRPAQTEIADLLRKHGATNSPLEAN